MRKWKQKWIKGTRGAISLLLALLLLPFYSLAAVLVEAGRYQSAVRALDGALGSSAFSVLANYDSYLKERFGLLALSQDGDLTNSAMGYLNNIQLTDLSSVSLASVSAQGMYPLADISVLRRQVLEYSKLTVPANLTVDMLQVNDLLSELEKATGLVPVLESFSSGCNTVSAEADALIALEDVKDAAEDTRSDIQAYNDGFTLWQNNVAMLISHLNTERPADEDEAKKWDDTKDDLVDEAEKARKDYKKAISNLISSLDKLQSKVTDVEKAREKFESSLTNFTSTTAESLIKTEYGDKNDQNDKDNSDSKDDKDDSDEIYDDVVKNHSAMQQALRTSGSKQNERMQQCLDSFKSDDLLAASAQLQKEETAVDGYDTDSVSKDWSTPDAATYHAAQVDSLADTSTLNQLLNEAEEEMNSSSAMDFINSLMDVVESLFSTKTVIDPALNAKLDEGYYNSTYGGLPSEKDRGSGAYALASGNAADEEKSKEYLAQIDPDYNPDDPYGVGGTFDTSLVERIMNDLDDMMDAAGRLTGDAENLRDFLEAIKDFVEALASLISHTVQFLGQIVTRVAELIGGAIYEHLLINGYLVYNVPNRTSNLTGGKALTGYSYGNAGISYDASGPTFSYPGSDLVTIIQALASGGGVEKKSFNGAELEYIIWGFNSEVGNQAAQFAALYLFRLLLNLPAILTNQEVSALAAAANVFAPVVYIVYIFLEPYIDTLILVNGDKVSLVKTAPYLTIGGMDDLIQKMTDLAIPDSTLADLKTEVANAQGTEVAKQAASAKPSDSKSPMDVVSDLFEMDYTKHSLLLMIVFGSETSYLNRFMDIIQTESTVYREEHQSLSQAAGGVSKDFDLDESYTMLRMEASGSLVQLLPIPALSTNSVFKTSRLIYRGY